MAPLQRSKSESQADQLQIQHFIHQHVLHKIFMTSEFNCDGCNTGGYGVRYRCNPCDFDIHEQCATSPYRISSHLHPHHHLILVNRPGDSHLCHVCKGVTNGLSYTCESAPACEFNVHTLCIQATGVKSLTLDPSTTAAKVAVGGYNGVNNSQPVVVASNHHYQHQPQQLQPQMQRMHTMPVVGYNGMNTSQPVMVNHQQNPTTSFGGYHGVNNKQTHMISQQPQPQQVRPMMGGYQMNNSQPVMVNHSHQQLQQQGMQTAGFGGYQNGMTGQPVMLNHHQQQQVMPTTAFNTNQQLMTNNHQQLLQQQQGAGIGVPVGGYNNVVTHNNQTVMIHHPPPPPPPPPQQQQSNGYAKAGKIAANILSTSLIGIPLFTSR